MRIASGFWVFFTGLALAGCGGDGLDGLLRTGPSDPQLACPSNLKTWDLGTGRASDIARLAPDFFTKDNGGARYRSLQPNVPGLSAIKPAIVGGVDGFEFMTPEPSYRVRALLTDMGTILLATPGQCAHLQARERCVDDRLHTEVDSRGRVACLGSVSVPGDSVMITLDGNTNKLRLVFGEPLSVGASHSDVSFDIFVPGADQPAGHVTRRRDDASDPLPEELVALLKASALEKSATSFYKGLQDSAKTPELDAEVVRLRIEGAKRVAARYDDPTKLVEMIRLHTVTVMPGDDEVLKVLSDRIAEVLRTSRIQKWTGMASDWRPWRSFSTPSIRANRLRLQRLRPPTDQSSQRHGPRTVTCNKRSRPCFLTHHSSTSSSKRMQRRRKPDVKIRLVRLKRPTSKLSGARSSHAATR